MIKRLICLLSVCVFGVVTNVVAAPSAKILGNNKSNISNARTSSVAPKKQNNAVVAKVAKPQVSTTKTNTKNSARLPSMVSVKTKANNVKPVTSSNITTIKPGNNGSSVSDSSSIVQRLEALESKNEKSITDVVENESGSYVSDIKIDGNNLVIEKTRLLQAPIRNKNGDDLNDTAEIWIIK